MAKQFDAASKHLIESRPRDWLALAGFPVPASEADVSIVDADLSNVMTMAADKLIRVENPPGRAEPYLAHIEFQSSADASLDARVLMYNVVSRRRHAMPVWSAVFLLRPEAAGNVKGRVVDRLDAVAGLDFCYHLLRVWELPAEAILSGGLGVLPLAPITAVQPNELPPLIDAVRQRLDRELSAQQGKEYLLAMRLLMGLRYQEQITEKLMQSIAELEDSVEWQKIYRRGKAEGEAKGKAEGEAKGKAEGEARGKVQGMADGERSMLIRLGTARFGVPSAAVAKKLKAISDLEQLQKISLRILNASSWKNLLECSNE